ncbi:hypothetical protein [Streptomyces thioluteus]
MALAPGELLGEVPWQMCRRCRSRLRAGTRRAGWVARMWPGDHGRLAR